MIKIDTEIKHRVCFLEREFCQSKIVFHSRERIKRENPEAGITEISKLAGEGWKNVGESVKKVGTT